MGQTQASRRYGEVRDGVKKCVELFAEFFKF